VTSTPSTAPLRLQRFVDAQAPVYENVLAEIKAGCKQTHWMWFVFPQLAGLGHSAMARRYGLRGLSEAQAYWAHPILGPRLAQCVEALLSHPELSARDILGGVDALKLRSCLTLFAEADGRAEVFSRALDRFYDGQRDEVTLKALGP
jgi:uncharacterized protein (DUF1810 family)